MLGIEELVQRLSNTKQSFAYINFKILYLLSVRVGGNLLSRIWWGYFMWKTLCMWVTSPGEECPSQQIPLLPVTWLTPSPAGEGRAGAACETLFFRDKFAYFKRVFLFVCFLQARLNCKHCGKPVIDVRIGMQYFSEYSNVQQCPHCGNLDYHFVKPFSSFKVLEAYWRKLCFSNSYFMGISTLLHIFL